MIKYSTQTVEQKVPESITCDVCKKVYDCKKDWEEVQEIYSMLFKGGYGSVFGDGNVLKLDICQHCMKKILGEYLVADEENSDKWPE